MCKKCETQENLNFPDMDKAVIIGNILYIERVSEGWDKDTIDIEEPINFCPYCGKELIEKPKEL